MNNLAALVAVQGVPSLLSYRIEHTDTRVEIGNNVTVEIGKHSRTGWVVDIVPLEEASGKATRVEKNTQQLSLIKPSEIKLKPLLSSRPGFSSDLLPLLQWISDYYGAPLTEVIENAVPSIKDSRELQYAQLSSHLTDTELAACCTTLEKRAPKQATLLKTLQAAKIPVAVATLEARCSGARAALRALTSKKLVTLSSQRFDVFLSSDHQTAQTSPPNLTLDQEAVLKTIFSAMHTETFAPMLLMGVTGSGKTEVYIRAIEQAFAAGKSALVVVPEIALTPQLLDRFSERLNQPIAVLHSQVSQAERWAAWSALLNGSAKIAIGARSAIFAPLKNLGLIIVDEEHESSYKQSDGLRYHGRDVAVMRAKFANCAVILGSATPSFESLLNVKRNRYQLLEMKHRVTARPLPQIEVVDLNTIRHGDMPSENISPQLHKALTETIAKGEQAIILYNRRGFSSYLQCVTCGTAVLCPSCSVTMTFHRNANRLLCHHCGYTLQAPAHCSCRDPRISKIELDAEGQPLVALEKLAAIGALEHRGGGTERVVDELALLFPTTQIRRMDRDTVTKRDAYREILNAMRTGETQILVGTQMIAKGHDLPNVTLVGIINADVGLHLPDFRASERAFQLITQAAGRAGRAALSGRVILQSREPDHPTIVAAVQNRFMAFARYELEYRKTLNYPPWGRLMRIIVSAHHRTSAEQFAKQVVAAAQHYLATDKEMSVKILGPAPAAIEKLRGRYRVHAVVKANSAAILSSLAQSLHQWRKNLKVPDDIRMTLDIDPLDML